MALELSPQSPRRQWRASASEWIPGRSSTGELSLTSHGYIGETEAASEKLVDLRFASATFFAEGGSGSCLALCRRGWPGGRPTVLSQHPSLLALLV